MEQDIVCKHTQFNMEHPCVRCRFRKERISFFSRQHYQAWLENTELPDGKQWQQKDDLVNIRQELASLREELEQAREQQEQLKQELLQLRQRVEDREASEKQAAAEKQPEAAASPSSGRPEPGETIADSWEQIFEAIDYGTYTFRYKIGDTKLIDLGSEGVIAMQIAAFHEDDMAYDSGKAAITWIGKQLLRTRQPMAAGSADTDGWGSSDLRKYLHYDILPQLPERIQHRLKPVVKRHKIGWRQQEETIDTLWLPDREEVLGENCRYRQLFYSDAARAKTLAGEEEAVTWWLRCSVSSDIYSFIDRDGYALNGAAANANGVALCFCT